MTHTLNVCPQEISLLWWLGEWYPKKNSVIFVQVNLWVYLFICVVNGVAKLRTIHIPCNHVILQLENKKNKIKKGLSCFTKKNI